MTEGLSKSFFENTDSSGLADVFSSDNDGDGIADDVDPLVEDAEDVSGDDPDAGIPDWHPKSKHRQ